MERAIRAAAGETAGSSREGPPGSSGEGAPGSSGEGPPGSSGEGAPGSSGEGPPVPLSAGIATLRVIEAARRSSDERAVVPL
jgi:hypothetical protein